MMDVFDIIHLSHSFTLGHMGKERTYADMSKQYYNHTQKVVESLSYPVFIETKTASDQKLNGSTKTILSHDFRDWLWVDLIDMKKKRRRNIHGHAELDSDLDGDNICQIKSKEESKI